MSVSVAVEVQIASSVASIPAEAEIRSWLEHAVATVCKQSDDAYEVAVRIVDEPEARELNRQYRQQDKATNVLSFPSANDAIAGLTDERVRPLGDVVICGPVVEREAAEQGKDPASHWSHLLVHGVLHLLGYDHESEAEAVQMEALERDLLAKRGIEDPYADV